MLDCTIEGKVKRHPKLELSHVDTCLPDYWSGDRRAHLQIAVHAGMSLAAIKQALRNELCQGCISGNDPLTRDDSGYEGDAWYVAAHHAINRMKPATKGQRRFFLDLSFDNDENSDSVCAYFVFEVAQ